MESHYAAFSLPDIAENGAQSIMGVSPVSASGGTTPKAGQVGSIPGRSFQLCDPSSPLHRPECSGNDPGTPRRDCKKVLRFPGISPSIGGTWRWRFRRPGDAQARTDSGTTW